MRDRRTRGKIPGLISLCGTLRGLVATAYLHSMAKAFDFAVPVDGKTVPDGDDCILKAQILEFDRRIIAWHRSSATSKRLDAIPGVGPALATALVVSIADPQAFRSGRDFSAWVGLVPKQNSSGGKDKLGSISKQGDRYLRSLFTAGALAVIRYAKIHGTDHRPWLTRLLARPRILIRFWECPSSN
ncbi:transposase [Bradyrhizobium erythrophlei]|uniref:transposase n=1 Tax=Bradyrhizobium erythrophlei TaxID=1437360 RepID=UPI0035EDAAFD